MEYNFTIMSEIVSTANPWHFMPLIGSKWLNKTERDLGCPTIVVAMVSLSNDIWNTLTLHIKHKRLKNPWEAGGRHFQLNLKLDVKQQHNWNKTTERILIKIMSEDHKTNDKLNTCKLCKQPSTFYVNLHTWYSLMLKEFRGEKGIKTGFFLCLLYPLNAVSKYIYTDFFIIIFGPEKYRKCTAAYVINKTLCH